MSAPPATPNHTVDAPDHTPAPPGNTARTGHPPLIAPLLGMCALLGGSTAVAPLLADLSWLTPTVTIVAVIYLLGIVGRLLAAPAVVVAVLQLAGLTVTATSLLLHSGVGGILPGPAALHEAATLIERAWDQIATTVPPAPTTAGITVVLVLTIGLLAVAVDHLAAARAPALVALPLLALYSVPASIARHMLPWYAFVLPAACFAAMLASDRISGMAQRRSGRLQAWAAGGRAATAAALAIVAALVITDVATPIGTEGRIPRHGHSSSEIGLSPWASLRGDLRASTPVDTLRVSGLDNPGYLRTFALERWEPGKGFVLGTVHADDNDIVSLLPGAPQSAQSDDRVSVTPQHYRGKYLPIYLHTHVVSGIGSGWDYDRGLHTIFRDTPATPNSYSITPDTDVISASTLRRDTVDATAQLTETGNLPDEVTDLARSLTANAYNAFDKADAILTYFTDPSNGFRYSLTTAPGNSGSALVDFLTNKQGYCEQYAATMAIMLRAVGIPSRIGVGFTQGTRQPDGSYQIESTNAHAWVEVKFSEAGWVRFDPTPSVDGQGGLQGFSLSDDNVTPAPSGTATNDESATGTAAATTTNSPTTTTAPTSTTASSTATSASTGSTGVFHDRPWIYLLAVLALVLLAALALVPSTIRRARRRRRRAAVQAGRRDAASSAWEEIIDTLTDHLVVFGADSSAREIANRAADAAGLSASGTALLRDVVLGAEEYWYGTTPATDVASPADHGLPHGDAQGLWRGVTAVAVGLAHHRQLSLWHRIYPRSLRRRGATPTGLQYDDGNALPSET